MKEKLETLKCPYCPENAVRESCIGGGFVCKNGHTFFTKDNLPSCELCGAAFDRGEIRIGGKDGPSFCYWCAVSECEKELERRSSSNRGLDRHGDGGLEK